MRSVHTTFVVLGNGLPLVVGLFTGLGAGDVLVLLFVEFFVGTLVNVRRVSLHRRLSRTRGHFDVVETDEGLRARGLSFPSGSSAAGVAVFLFAFYGFLVWGLLRMYDLALHPHLLRYVLMSAAPPVVEYLLQRPGLGRRPFAWIERYGQDTAGRLVAFGVMIPVGGVGLMLGPVPGLVAMALAKGLVETLWHGLFRSLRERRRVLPGFEGDPGIQREWRQAVAEYARTSEHSEQVLDEATWHRMMREASGDFSHVRKRGEGNGEPRVAGLDRPRTPATARREADSAGGSPPEVAAPRPSDEPHRVLQARVGEPRAIELIEDGEPIARLTAPRGLERWTGQLEGRPVSMKVAVPWNRFVWQIRAGDEPIATAKQPRAFGLIRMPSSFRVHLSAGEYHWAIADRHSQLWQLTDTEGEVVHGELRPGTWEEGRDELEIPASLSAADALFLVWLREQARALTRR